MGVLVQTKLNPSWAIPKSAIFSVMSESLNSLGEDVKQIVAKEAPVWQGTFKDKLIVHPTIDALGNPAVEVFSEADHQEQVEKGRGPGPMGYEGMAKLRRWVEDKVSDDDFVFKTILKRIVSEGTYKFRTGQAGPFAVAMPQAEDRVASELDNVATKIVLRFS